eukprot:jgi/Psemu1/70048/estExt_Genemark1.C_13300003
MASNFRDDSTECAICLEPLEAASKSEQQANTTARNEDQRILFNCFQCAKCATIIKADDHRDLPEDLFRTADELRSQVNALIKQHGLREAVAREEFQGEGKQPPRETLDQEVMRKYAFYLCSHCENPYFAHEKVQNRTGRNEDSAHPVLPQTRASAESPPCTDTVTCGSVGIAANQRLIFATEANKDEKVLEAIPCPGDSCLYPKPNPNSRFHSNGPSEDCEQVYSCVLCETGHDDLSLSGIEPGSRNFVVNPSGQDGFNGWEIFPQRGYSVWKVENTPFRPHEPLFLTPVLRRSGDPASQNQLVTTNFASSFTTCIMIQKIDLRNFLRLSRQETETTNAATVSPLVQIDVSARHSRCVHCGGQFQMDVILTDGMPHINVDQRWWDAEIEVHGVVEVKRKSTGTKELDFDSWVRVSLDFNIGTLEDIAREYRNFPTLTLIIRGKDKKFWAGNYGSKVADICVRVLGDTPNEIDALVLSPEEQRVLNESSGRDNTNFEAGSRNFVVNPGGQDGIQGWVRRGFPWNVFRRTSLLFNLGTLEDIGRQYQKFPTMTVIITGGNYRSKVADICVRVLRDTPDKIDALVLSPEEQCYTADEIDASSPEEQCYTTDEIDVRRNGRKGCWSWFFG